MSDGMRRELAYLSSHATNRYFIPNWGIRNIPLQENTAFLYMHRQLLDSQQTHAFLSASWLRWQSQKQRHTGASNASASWPKTSSMTLLPFLSPYRWSRWQTWTTACGKNKWVCSNIHTRPESSRESNGLQPPGRCIRLLLCRIERFFAYWWKQIVTLCKGSELSSKHLSTFPKLVCLGNNNYLCNSLCNIVDTKRRV